MPDSSTYYEIEQEVLRILGQRDPEVSMVPIPLNGLAAADGLTITSLDLALNTSNANRFDGRIVKVTEDSTALAFTPAVTITGVHTAATTTLTVNSTTDIRQGMVLGLNASEMVYVETVVSTTVLKVRRGYQGSTAAAYTGTEAVTYEGFGTIAGVDDAGLAAGGILTISPNLPDTGQVTGGPYLASSFLMYPKGLHPDIVRNAINAVLANTEAPALWAPSLVTDSDMDAADLTNWDAVGSPGTREFVTAAGSILYGERALHLASANDGVGAETENFDVTEGDVLTVMVFTRVLAGSMEVVLRDETAGATTRAIIGLEERAYTTTWFTESVPSESLQMSLRFLGESTGSEFFVSPYVIVQSQARVRYALPSWWTRSEQLIESVRLSPGYASDVSNSYISLSDYIIADSRPTFIRSDGDANPHWVEVAPASPYPVAFLVKRPFEALNGDASTTVADKTYVAWKAVSRILRDRQDKEWAAWGRMAQRRARLLGYGGRELRSQEVLTAV